MSLNNKRFRDQGSEKFRRYKSLVLKVIVEWEGYPMDTHWECSKLHQVNWTMHNGWALQYSVLTCYEYTTILPISKKNIDGHSRLKKQYP